MTKLTEWIVFAGLAFSIWITLLTDILPLKVSYKAKEVIWPMPVYALIVFGCYSLATIGYRVATFNDCEEASESLKQEIKDAREDLSRKGFKFDWNLTELIKLLSLKWLGNHNITTWIRWYHSDQNKTIQYKNTGYSSSYSSMYWSERKT